MAKFLFHGSYSVEGIKGVRKEGGTSRRAAIEKMSAAIGATVESFYFAFGDDDFFVTVDAPDNISAAAVATAVAATGAVRLKTTVLLTPEDVDAATRIDVSYRPPGT